MTTIQHFGRAIWVGKIDAVIAQIRMTARRESDRARSIKPFSIHPEVYQRMEKQATETQVTNESSIAGEALKTSPALQDIDDARDDYSRGLSGRV
jgi:hypothetical protein